MKKIGLLLLLTLCGVPRLWAQAEEIQQLLLNVEKLAQHKQILEDMKKGYQFVTTGYTAIKDAAQGNFRLHHDFLDGLLQVSPGVRKYKKVSDIIAYQLLLVNESRQAYRRFREEGHFRPQELDYLDRVYDRLLLRSLDNLEALNRLLTERQLRMSDEERLASIDALYLEMQDMLLALRHFNSSTAVLGLQRAKERHALNDVRSMYGITPSY
ncbi:MAG: TerB family tellurite resistance protein [Hymenobacteraceae bacterium]|nr:TerB family tellurite resistance protein [Hymenobacteraceae bacterium]MDX5481969.1 TerB family tellurite resistance protein [Hymenobacteraceae bacterium]